MFGTILACVLALQAPQSPVATWVAAGGAPARPRALKFSGSVELSPAAAQVAAESRVRDALVDRIRRQAIDRLDTEVPVWMPRAFLDRAIDRWTVEQMARDPYEILERAQTVRDHGFGNSYQTHLLVEPVAPSEREWRALGRKLDRLQQGVLGLGGGTLALWFVLIAAFWWVDRLSRGYMTGRLAVLALGVGVLAPCVAFLFVQ